MDSSRCAGALAPGPAARFPEVITLLGSASADPSENTGELGATVSTPRPGLTVLRARGEVDTLTSPQLDAGLDELLAVPDGALAVDLSDVTFLASSGLGVLIRAARRAARSRRVLHVVTRSRAVLRPLEVTGSAQLFAVVGDVDEIEGPGTGDAGGPTPG